jgi:hypothetical protein
MFEVKLQAAEQSKLELKTSNMTLLAAKDEQLKTLVAAKDAELKRALDQIARLQAQHETMGAQLIKETSKAESFEKLYEVNRMDHQRMFDAMVESMRALQQVQSAHRG